MGSPIDFFDDLCRKTDGGKKLPSWKGELYLELHRGVSLFSLVGMGYS
jgi:alpha-mannosidase